ncbi:MAG: NAD/NADP octopine/nopaline dehydrogenase family protein [Candidatus Thorarchaeota archaeon]
MTKVAILGAGHAGKGLAGHLSLKGFNISLYNRTFSNIRDIEKSGNIKVTGIVEGTAPIHMVTDDPRIAIKNRDILLVAVPATGHESIAHAIGSYLEPGQVILLMPGRTGGALEFINVLRQYGTANRIIIGESESSSFISRSTGTTSVENIGMKEAVDISALPATYNDEFMERLSALPLNFQLVADVMVTSLNNMGAMLHPVPTLLCAGLIESMGGKYNHFRDGISSIVGRLIEKMDNERMRIAKNYVKNPMDIFGWFKETYCVEGESLCGCIKRTDAYEGLSSPTSLDHNFVLEDVPTGLVPLSYLGRMAGIRTPVIDNIIELAGQLYDTQFWRTGRTLRKMGIDDLEPEPVLEYVRKGTRLSEKEGKLDWWETDDAEVNLL